MKVRLNVIEEIVLNPKYEGLRQARVEAYLEDALFPIEVGHIRIWNSDELFDSVCKEIDGY